MTRTSDELQAQLHELDAGYKVAAHAARAARERGEDPADHWRACKNFYSMATRARAQILLAQWSAE
jgi:hypothetical protein